MYSVTKEIKWEMGHRLTLHKGKCFNLHGHSYRAFITVESNTLDDNGMVMDFYQFGPVKNWVDLVWDHAMMLNENDPIYNLHQLGTDYKMVLVEGEPTAENIARWLFEAAAKILPDQISFWIKDVTVWETATSNATYNGI